MTVTVWKNKIRVRHASLGELRQKIKPTKNASWITIRSDVLAVFNETQIKCSATRKDKLLYGRWWCWWGITVIWFLIHFRMNTEDETDLS